MYCFIYVHYVAICAYSLFGICHRVLSMKGVKGTHWHFRFYIMWTNIFLLKEWFPQIDTFLTIGNGSVWTEPNRCWLLVTLANDSLSSSDCKVGFIIHIPHMDVHSYNSGNRIAYFRFTPITKSGGWGTMERLVIWLKKI